MCESYLILSFWCCKAVFIVCSLEGLCNQRVLVPLVKSIGWEVISVSSSRNKNAVLKKWKHFIGSFNLKFAYCLMVIHVNLTSFIVLFSLLNCFKIWLKHASSATSAGWVQPEGCMGHVVLDLCGKAVWSRHGETERTCAVLSIRVGTRFLLGQ